ncbi:MAG: hypothetical protein ACR2NZ_21895 [Rubripirellula sp.]
MAKLDDLKAAWQSESGVSQERFEQIGQAVTDSTTRLQSVIFRRDMVETIASLIVVVGFGYWMWVANSRMEQFGCLIVVVAGATIPIVLWLGRRRPEISVSAGNFRDFVDVEVDYLRRQVQLLRMVGWWYLLPLYLGVALIMIGIMGPTYSTGKIVCLSLTLFVAALCYVFLWWINQKAREKNLDPMLAYYVEMQDALERGDGFDTLTAGPPSGFLRPENRVTISRNGRRIGMVMTLLCTGLVVVGGYWLLRTFDARTGWFVISSAPVVAILVGFCCQIWRPLES